jgi:predicted MFS family arabinose efflux permease
VHTFAIIALVGIPASPNFLIVTIPYITRMVLMNMTWPIFQSFSLSQVPEEHRSLTISSTNLSFNATKAVTPFVAGYIFEVSLEIPFLITAALYTVATIAFYWFFRKKDDKESDIAGCPADYED